MRWTCYWIHKTFKMFIIWLDMMELQQGQNMPFYILLWILYYNINTSFAIGQTAIFSTLYNTQIISNEILRFEPVYYRTQCARWCIAVNGCVAANVVKNGEEDMQCELIDDFVMGSAVNDPISEVLCKCRMLRNWTLEAWRHFL